MRIFELRALFLNPAIGSLRYVICLSSTPWHFRWSQYDFVGPSNHGLISEAICSTSQGSFDEAAAFKSGSVPPMSGTNSILAQLVSHYTGLCTYMACTRLVLAIVNNWSGSSTILPRPKGRFSRM